MSSLTSDLRYSFRQLRKKPGASLVIVLTLGIGIGINATFFSGFHAMVLAPLPFEQPEELVAIHGTEAKRGKSFLSISIADFLDWRTQAAGFEALEAYQHRSFNLRTDDLPERVRGARITPGLFPMLGIAPARGRGFTSADGRPGLADVAILSDDLWRRSFGADPGIIGRTLDFDGTAHRIVGVMPPGFAFPLYEHVWTPLVLDRSDAPRAGGSLNVIGRLESPLGEGGRRLHLNGHLDVVPAGSGWTTDPFSGDVINA